MKSIGYKQSNSDHTLFLKHNKEQITTLIMYVDDMIVTGNNTEESNTLQEHLVREFAKLVLQCYNEKFRSQIFQSTYGVEVRAFLKII